MAHLLFWWLFSTTSAQNIGGVTIQNTCKQDVYIDNTPAANGGFVSYFQTLEPGEEFYQQWTKLTNGDSWSVKMSYINGSFGDNIMQFEYTFHNDGTIWYDLSQVDGCPWQENWCISSPSDTCHLRQVYYRFSTDDAFGMQAYPQDAEILVTLCDSTCK